MMKSKKILSFLLAVMLVIGVTPLTAFAYGGDDTATNQTVEASSGEESRIGWIPSIPIIELTSAWPLSPMTRI